MEQLTKHPRPLRLELEAIPASVTEARKRTAEYARGVGAEAEGVELAVAEAVANAVVHGFTDRPHGTVRLVAEQEGASLIVRVTDNGSGMRPNPDRGGLGLGLALIGQLTSAFSVTAPEGGGTSLRMAFPIGATPGGPV
jgi:stage II sporulation protein AB (anti-sigma F factor)